MTSVPDIDGSLHGSTPGFDGSRSRSAVKQALAIILAGGRGSRLGPLTDWRAKPALPFGGKFRIIDFPLSNCVNSGIRRIGICTQYKAQSLIRHVQHGWSFLDGRFDEFVELLPAQQRLTATWYNGTADAVYQNLDILRRHAPDHVVMLAGDHVYKMDYGVMLAEHIARDAQVSIACIDVGLEEAHSFGIVSTDAMCRIIDFVEKPAKPPAMPGRADRALASMGVYIFDADFLYAALLRDAANEQSTHDFGKDLIPALVREGARVYAHDYSTSCVNVSEGPPYWRDVGTVDAYWQANIALTDVVPQLDLYDRQWPIWTLQRQLPPAKFVFDDDARRGMAVDSLVAGGCIVSGSLVRRSVLFSGARINNGCRLEQSVVMPNVEIGNNVTLNAVVVDKHCRLPAGLVVGMDAEQDRRRFHVTPSGVTVITPEMLGQALHSATAGVPDSRSEGIRLEHAVQRRIEESGSGLEWTSPHRNVPRHGTPPSARTR